MTSGLGLAGAASPRALAARAVASAPRTRSLHVFFPSCRGVAVGKQVQ